MELSPVASFEIAGRKVGMGSPCYFIAEAGVSHFGSLEKAYRLVDLARDAGADAVKFQIFQTDALLAEEANQWRQRLGSRCLPASDFREIRDYCVEKGITFFATAHDEPSLDYLDELGVPVYKIGSGEVENWEFIKNVATRGKPVIFSTGMYTMVQVGLAMETILETGNQELAILHCVTRYPTPADEINMRAMSSIRNRFGAITGYSDHTEGRHIPLAAVALGADILEKHISLDFNVPDAQDWKVSCGPHDLADLVREIRDIEACLGSEIKKPSSGELESLKWGRKSLVVTEDIPVGSKIQASHLTTKRPGTGISPAQMGDVVGRSLRKPIKRGQLLSWEHLT
jgi:N,N'-diacetyllegionaminate synthase